jgi:hypothetical protein
LSDAGEFMDFVVYRELEGTGRFMPIEAKVVQLGALSYTLIDNSFELGSSYRYRVDVTDEQGTRTLFETEIIKSETPRLALSQNYPNPFNPSTTIHFNIPERAHVTLDIFDVSGCRITRLVDSIKGAGPHKKEWSGCNKDGITVSSGVYFYKLTAGKKSITRKMILMR